MQRYESAVEAELAGSAPLARRAPVDLPAGRLSLARAAGPVLAAILVAVWLVVDPHTPDLAAAVYRVDLYRHLGLAVWDEHWYAGHHLPGYSLLFPPLGALMGIRVVGALCALASTFLFGRLLGSVYGEGAAWGTAAFAVAAVGDVWLGRLAFALGVSLALAAGLALRRGHPLGAAALAALCAAASPVAALLLALAGCTVALVERSVRPALALAAAPGAVVLALALLFPEGGDEPFPLLSFLATAGVVAVFLAALPGEARLLRVGGVLYLAVCVACLLVSSPVGSNIERYGVLLAAPLLLCARLGRGGPTSLSPRRGATGGIGWMLAVAAIGVWVLWGPVRETAAVDASPATEASFYEPVERFLGQLGGEPVRVEVPLTRSHWEAALLAPRVSLARGWEKQMETRYEGVVAGGHPTAVTYRRWLDGQAVSYVALPDVRLDPSSVDEGRLIRSGLPYLRLVFADSHWRIYRVLGARPILSGPGRLSRLGHDYFTVAAGSAGTFDGRIRFTRYWTITQGRGCVEEAPGGWTRLRVPGPGTVRVSARFSLGAALDGGGSCRRG